MKEIPENENKQTLQFSNLFNEKRWGGGWMDESTLLDTKSDRE